MPNKEKKDNKKDNENKDLTPKDAGSHADNKEKAPAPAPPSGDKGGKQDKKESDSARPEEGRDSHTKKRIKDMDIKKARDIVLNAISEGEKPEKSEQTGKETEEDASPLFFKNKESIKPKKEVKLSESEKEKGAKEIGQISGEEKQSEESPEPLFLKKEKLTKLKKEKAQSYAPQSKAAEGETEKAASVGDKQGKKDKKAEEAEQKKESSVPLSLKIKKYFKKKRIIKKRKIKRLRALKQKKMEEAQEAALKKEKEKRQSRQTRALEALKNRVSFKNNLKITSSKKTPAFSSISAKSVKNTLSYTFVVSILCFIIFYSFFVISVTQFNLAGKITRYIAEYLPVPAVITTYGVIDYFDYRAALKKDQNAKVNLIKNLVKKDLADKYNLDASSPAFDEKLNYKILSDYSVNKSSIDKLRVLQNLLNNNHGFDEIIKYGDEYSAGAMFNKQDAIDKFGEKVDSLSAGQISDIIISYRGYFAVKIISKNNNNIYLNYLFIDGKNLDDYLDEKIIWSKVWSLVD
jgi:hypothetical protein